MVQILYINYYHETLSGSTHMLPHVMLPEAVVSERVPASSEEELGA